MKKLKLAVLTLLGFSTACSTVKNTPRSEVEIPTEEPTTKADTAATPDESEVIKVERIKLMYGTPSPRPTAETEENK